MLHFCPAGIAPPLILPVIICSLCLVVEVIGDVTATRAASRLETSGDEHNDSVSGGIRADGISTFLGALATAMPVVCFAQNNGVIQLTNCASRWVLQPQLNVMWLHVLACAVQHNSCHSRLQPAGISIRWQC